MKIDHRNRSFEILAVLILFSSFLVIPVNVHASCWPLMLGGSKCSTSAEAAASAQAHAESLNCICHPKVVHLPWSNIYFGHCTIVEGYDSEGNPICTDDLPGGITGVRYNDDAANGRETDPTYASDDPLIKEKQTQPCAGASGCCETCPENNGDLIGDGASGFAGGSI